MFQFHSRLVKFDPVLSIFSASVPCAQIYTRENIFWLGMACLCANRKNLHGVLSPTHVKRSSNISSPSGQKQILGLKYSFAFQRSAPSVFQIVLQLHG